MRKGVCLSNALLLQVQNVRATEVKVEMGFLNVAVSFSIFPTLLSALLLSVCFTLWCVCSAVCSLENLSTHYAQSSRKAVCSTELFKCFQSCTLNLQVPDHMPSSFVDFFSVFFFFPFPLFLLQLSERARERKVPVTRIGRLANFGGRFAPPQLQSYYACMYY